MSGANGLVPFARNEFLIGDLDWVVDLMKIILIDEADDVPDDTEDFYSNIAAAARVGTLTEITSRATPDTVGAADGADTTLSSVTGDVSEGVVGIYDTTVEATSPMVFYIGSATGLPVTPNGGDITVQWQATSPYIFKL